MVKPLEVTLNEAQKIQNARGNELVNPQTRNPESCTLSGGGAPVERLRQRIDAFCGLTIYIYIYIYGPSQAELYNTFFSVKLCLSQVFISTKAKHAQLAGIVEGLQQGEFPLEVCTPPERLVIHCQTTGVSAAHATHCATYCTPCRPLIRAFSGWIRTPPPTPAQP